MAASDAVSRRPKSKNAEKEEPPQEGQPFDYDAQPDPIYFNLESAGGMEPDAIVQQGIKVLQQKLATVIHNLTEGEGDHNNATATAAFDGEPQSPQYNNTEGWQDGGYTTPYGGGNQSTWGGAGGGTAYGSTTPYGGQNEWNG